MVQSTRTAKSGLSPSRPYPDNESPPRNDAAGSRARNTSPALGAGGGGESSMRPRNTRLASTELQSTGTSSGSSTTSRVLRPMPSKHPSRTQGVSGLESNTRSGRMPAGAGFAGLLEGNWKNSWTKLQGLASSALGGEMSDDDDRKGGRMDKPLPKRRGSTSKKFFDLPSGSWGPAERKKTAQNAIGNGSVTDREAEVRRRKLRGVMEGRGELNGAPDANGNYKRRSSTDDVRDTAQDEGDALVYIHHVQSQDTMAGVMLRYDCQSAVFKKANRFWPNDSIQIRKVVVLPVDACAVRGRPCEPPAASPEISKSMATLELLAPTSHDEGSNVSWPPTPPSGSNGTSADRSDDQKEWEHVRWVRLDSNPTSKPVEIGRMPRKALGYFPPRRRRSTVVSREEVSTPRASTDLVSQVSGSPETPSRRTNNALRPPPNTSGGHLSTISSRPRRPSADAADRLNWMRGPGGVGSLNKSKPGPGEDALNNWARKHMPGITIEPSSSSHSSDQYGGYRDELDSIAELDSRHFAPLSGTVTPSNLLMNGAGQGLGLEAVAAKVEGWFRRSISKGPGTPKQRAREPDLIELVDGGGSDDGRFELSPRNGRGMEDMEGCVRGRAMSSSGGGKGKSD